MPRTRRSVVVVTRDPRTRRRVESALSGRTVRFVEPSTDRSRGRRVVGDVGIVDVGSTEWTESTGAIAARQVIVVGRGGTAGGDVGSGAVADAGAVTGADAGAVTGAATTVIAKPVDPGELRAAVDRAHRRQSYADGLEAYAAAVLGMEWNVARGEPGGSERGVGDLAALRERLAAIVAEFDHEDFVSAFEAVGNR